MMNKIRDKYGNKGVRGVIIIAVAVAIVILLLALYIRGVNYYNTHFFPNTKVNGVDVGRLTAEEAQGKLSQQAQDYLLTIYDRTGEKYHLKGYDINYEYQPEGEEKNILDAQRSVIWPSKLLSLKEHTIGLKVSFDEQLLEKEVDGLACFDEENTIPPQNAKIELTENGFEVIPEISGNKLIQDKVKAEILQTVKRQDTEINLSDDVYENPKTTANSPTITQCMDTLDNYMKASITYDIADNKEVVDQSMITKWLDIDDDYVVALDEDEVARYVQTLASKYNTYGDERKFKTTVGGTVIVGGGDYGWVINKTVEEEQLLQEIKAGEVVTREPVYEQIGKQREADDIGNSYVEIDYTNQHLWYYEEGILIVDTDIVSGNISTGHGSPDGVFKIVYKESPSVLRGEDYASDVTYFMPFAYNVGIHDASWRNGKFGGDIYKTSGSHGCINVPKAAAETIYKVISTGTPVVAYYRDEVELTAENARISNAYSYVEPIEEP